MEKYKFRSTVYLVFLLVSLFVNGLVLYMLITDYPSKQESKELDRNINVDKVMEEINTLYSDAYNYVNGESFIIPSDYVDSNNPNHACYLVDLDGLNDYFTGDVINQLNDNLIADDNRKIDCNGEVEKIMLSGIFNKNNKRITKLDYVFNDSDIFLVSGLGIKNSRPLYLVFKLVDGHILIDSFE